MVLNTAGGSIDLLEFSTSLFGTNKYTEVAQIMSHPKTSSTLKVNSLVMGRLSRVPAATLAFTKETSSLKACVAKEGSIRLHPWLPNQVK